MLKYGRKGMYEGKLYWFTHIDKFNNTVYSPDIKSFVDNMYGMWVSIKKVKWVDENERRNNEKQ